MNLLPDPTSFHSTYFPLLTRAHFDRILPPSNAKMYFTGLTDPIALHGSPS